MSNDRKLLDLYSVSIAVTDKCNMHCAHCLRGDGCGRNIPFQYIDNFLDGVQSIGSLTFTGGEPTLNVPAIRHTLDYLKAHDIALYGFYIVTNGKYIPDDFLRVCMDLWVYTVGVCGGEADMCGVTISRDMYHEEIGDDPRRLLSAFSFFRPEDKTTDWEHIPLLNRGRATELDAHKRNKDYTKLTVNDYGDNIGVEDCDVSLTVDGYILSDCDYSYEDVEDYAVCRVDHPGEFAEYINDLAVQDAVA